MYRYYEGGVSSVYLWDTEEGGFAGVVLIKKSECNRSPSTSFETITDAEVLLLFFVLTDTDSSTSTASWDSGKSLPSLLRFPPFLSLLILPPTHQVQTETNELPSRLIVHVFESLPRSSSSSKTTSYKLTSTVMLYLSSPVLSPSSQKDGTEPGEGNVNLGGSMTRQVKTLSLSSSFAKK